MDPKKLREQRARIWEQMKEILDRASGEDRDLTGEERAAYDKAEAELTEVTENLRIAEAHAARVTDLDVVDRSGVLPPADQPDDAEREKRYAHAFGSWLRGGNEMLTGEERAVLRNGMLDGRELRALGIATGAAGGNTVPAGFRDELIETMKFYGSVQSVAQVLQTDSGQTLPWPTVDDTANVGAILAENTQMTQQDVTFGQAQLAAYMYTSKLVLVSFQLLNDSAVDVEAYLRRALAERIGRIWNQHFTTGTGTSQPLGVQTNAVVGKQGAVGQTTTVTYDDIIDLIHSVDPAYRQGGRVRFMLGDTALKVIRKLKDSQNRPLWEPSLQSGSPDSLLGYPITVNNDMPAPAASVKSILFGDFFAAYVIRIVNDFTLIRFNERYADFLQVGFAGYARADATLQQTAAVRAYQQSAT